MNWVNISGKTIISKRAYVQVRLWDNSWVMSNKFLKYLKLDKTNMHEMAAQQVNRTW